MCDNHFAATRKLLILKTERCQSGRLSTLGKRLGRRSPSDTKSPRRAIDSTTCSLGRVQKVGMFFRTRRIAASERFEIEHVGPARVDCRGTSRVYTDRNSRDRRVQRNSAAGNWMVGPPSSGREIRRVRFGHARSVDRSHVVCASSVAATCSRYGTAGSRSDNSRGSSQRYTRPRFHSTSRPIAGTSRSHDTLPQLGGPFVERTGCAPAVLQGPRTLLRGFL